MADCEHKNQEITVIVLHCLECGQSKPIRLARGEFATRVQQVRQGLIDADLLAGQIGADHMELLKAVKPCEHPKAHRRTCRCHGQYREICDACGRRFADESQFVLR